MCLVVSLLLANTFLERKRGVWRLASCVGCRVGELCRCRLGDTVKTPDEGFDCGRNSREESQTPEIGLQASGFGFPTICACRNPSTGLHVVDFAVALGLKLVTCFCTCR